jgi:hypothetical protein
MIVNSSHYMKKSPEVLIEALARELSVLPLAGIGRDSLPEPKMSEDE